jgi:hypothetical protein
LLLKAAVLVSMLAAVHGCQEARSDALAVAGKVTVDGKPLEDGQIVFTSLGEGGTRTSARIENGEFSIPPKFGVKNGEQLVQIEAFRKSNRPVVPSGLLTAEKAAKGAVEQYLPAKYNTQSKLSVEVQPGSENFFEFKLTE